MTLVHAEAEKNIKNVTAARNKFFLSPMMPLYRKILLCAASGLLLILSFPKFDLAGLAWISLIPLYIAITRSRGVSEAAWLAGFCGLVFFSVSFLWLRYVTVFGWGFVLILESGFLMLFGAAVHAVKRFSSPFLRSFLAASAWAGVEIVRTEIPVFGLGWNLLAYSQASFLEILQTASLFGAFGLSFVMAFVNILLAEAAEAFFSKSPERRERMRRSGMLVFTAVAVFALCFAWGRYRITQPKKPQEMAGISVIQGNIPQSIKWEAMARDQILAIHLKLTQLAAFEEPHLIIWPEAAFPGYFERARDKDEVLNVVREIKIPLLLGSPHYESYERVYNSAYLVNQSGEITQRYDKVYLVPFGEYVPLGILLRWLEPFAQAMGVSGFSAGTQRTVFRLEDVHFPFSVLICFEDVFPALARRFAEGDVKFLSVITNDAWFGPSAAPYQHLQASIFRAVENGIPVVRAANTGISAFISKKGEILGKVQDEEGRDIFVSGIKTVSLPLERKPTGYRMGGWLLPYILSVLFLIMVARDIVRRRKAGERRQAS